MPSASSFLWNMRMMKSENFYQWVFIESKSGGSNFLCKSLPIALSNPSTSHRYHVHRWMINIDCKSSAYFFAINLWLETRTLKHRGKMTDVTCTTVFHKKVSSTIPKVASCTYLHILHSICGDNISLYVHNFPRKMISRFLKSVIMVRSCGLSFV